MAWSKAFFTIVDQCVFAMASGKGVIQLEWDTFQTNISEHYQSLRGVQDFTDVTLVCKDLSKTDAHRIILAAGSSFFSSVLGGEQMKSHPHPMIFLPGVTRATLVPLLDFFYSGQASVAQGDLQEFLLLSKTLGVSSLIQNEEDNLDSSGDQNEYKIPASENKVGNFSQDLQMLKEETPEERHFEAKETTEDEMFRTLNGVSTCNVCELTINNKSELSGHMKEHLKEMQNCVSERKTIKKRSKAWNFFTPNDKLSASCDICNVEIKTSGGTTSSLYNHLRGKHKMEYSSIEGRTENN